jgi:hypothetical protein
VPAQPTGILLASLAITFSGVSAAMSVVIRPDVTVLTVIPIPSSQRFGQPEQSRLRRGVVRLADVARFSDHGRHVDDAPLFVSLLGEF